MAFINTLYNLWPNGDQKVRGLRDGIAATAPAVFDQFKVPRTPLVVSHVMAQISHECGAGHDVVESLNYSAERMTEVWPGRFQTIAAAAPYAHDERALGIKTYGGRMGNRPNTEDGYTYRGRGGSQVTGRDGYARLEKATGLPVLDNPDLVLDPQYFMLCAVADFVACGCLPFALQDDVAGVSSMLNVGHLVTDTRKIVGYAERVAWLKKWKDALGSGPIDFAVPYVQIEPPPKPPPPTPVPVPPAPAQSAWGSFFAAILSLFKGNK
ncbi:glycoside hydrolase family 19 protein [Bradyrhizobium arachidis]|uniref:glycoside hydrolase family 19 protein n=1 Tax=Bradyrhizobium arachidis TaxID=858423 RepID=UPI002161BA61|nr:glycoside hydrolase family 19 protein [Bradyrhizobium arachidis]UVO33944.1 glycoside hydrolase family 19 protein [Bradyrhizobium arachidis]